MDKMINRFGLNETIALRVFRTENPSNELCLATTISPTTLSPSTIRFDSLVSTYANITLTSHHS